MNPNNIANSMDGEACPINEWLLTETGFMDEDDFGLYSKKNFYKLVNKQKHARWFHSCKDVFENHLINEYHNSYYGRCPHKC